MWMDLIVAYLKNGELPKNKTKGQILRLKATHYVIYNDKLYRRRYLMPFLKCVAPLEAKYVMKEIHEGICGNHAGVQSLVFKTLKPRY